MDARSDSLPKATPKPNALDVGPFPIDSDQTILPSDRSFKWNTANGICISQYYLATTDGVGGKKDHGKWVEAERDPKGLVGSQGTPGFVGTVRSFLSSSDQCLQICKNTPRYTGCAYDSYRCIPYIGIIKGGNNKSGARCHFREEFRFKCHDWSAADKRHISQGMSQKEACERYHKNVFTDGDGTKAPGCGSCWCCKPDKKD